TVDFDRDVVTFDVTELVEARCEMPRLNPALAVHRRQATRLRMSSAPAPRAATQLPRRRAWLRIFVVRCSSSCDPPGGGHSCIGGLIARWQGAVAYEGREASRVKPANDRFGSEAVAGLSPFFEHAAIHGKMWLVDGEGRRRK